MAAVVGVHGMAQEQTGRWQLLRDWEPSFKDGLLMARGADYPAPSFDLAFYGDLFLSEGDQGLQVVVPTGRGGAAGTGRDLIAEGDGEGVLKGAMGGPGGDEASLAVGADELEFLEQAADEAVVGLPDLGEPLGFTPVPRWLQPLTSRLVRRLDATKVMRFITVLRHVYLYQKDDDLAELIRARVIEKIGDGCAVLIGHSLGTLVAFETLALNPDLRVDTLITLGSPLGMRTVADGLRGPRRPGGVPSPKVRRWVNIYDPADPVAAAGPASSLWPQAEDFTVLTGDQPHAIIRYLGKRITGETVATAIETA